MAINLECINFLVPIAIIEKKYPGGWVQCQRDYCIEIDSDCYDSDLFRIGAMNSMDIDELISSWKAKGFRTHVLGKNPRWIDVCVVDSFANEPTLPCTWIEIRDGRAFRVS